MVANILPADTTRPWDWGQNSTFSEHGLIAYPRMQQHSSKYFASRPHPGTTGVKIQLFM